MATGNSQKIDSAIKHAWKLIAQDYENHHLYMEGTLHCSFYHHLRQILGEEFFDKNNIRTYEEYPICVKVSKQDKAQAKRADFAVVKLENNKDGRILDKVKSVLAIVEFKYGGNHLGSDRVANPRSCYREIDKTVGYICHAVERERMERCKYYLGFILERGYFDYEPWLCEKKWKKHDDKREAIVVLSAHAHKDDLTMSFWIENENQSDKNSLL